MPLAAVFETKRTVMKTLGIKEHQLRPYNNHDLLEQKALVFVDALCFATPSPLLFSNLSTAIKHGCLLIVRHLLNTAGGGADSIIDESLKALYAGVLAYKQHGEKKNGCWMQPSLAIDLIRALVCGTQGRKKHCALSCAAAVDNRAALAVALR